MSDDLWYLLYIPLGVGIFFAFFFCVTVAACLWEKQQVLPYFIPASGEEYEPSSEADRANRQAKKLDYRYGGFCHAGHGKLYRVRVDFWISSDNCTIARVSSGTIAKIPVNTIWLLSRHEDGRILSTTNDRGDQDISGTGIQQTWPDLSFMQLDSKHEHFLDMPLDPFPPDDPLRSYFDLRRKKIDAMVEKKYGYYLDEERSSWRLTLRGALAFYGAGVWGGPIRWSLRTLGLIRE